MPASRRIAALALLVFSCAILRAQSIALTGTILTPQKVMEHGTLLIEAGRITAVGTDITLPKNTKIVAVDGIIAPGFIDLHNHMTWNVFPRWKPNEVFGARYDWQQRPVYNILMNAPHAELHDLHLDCEEERYAEMKAIASGETSTVGSFNEPPGIGCRLGLTRELDVDPGLSDFGPQPTILYNVFPFQMDEKAVSAANTALSATPRGSLLVHVSEGSPHDASAAREWLMFKARGLLRPGVSIIHGVAIPPSGFAEMAHAGVGFIWSPRSNIELYGDTAPVAAAVASGVTMAIAPDWSPTGSVGTLGELSYASVWNHTQQPSPLSERDLVLMATANPARLVNLDNAIGTLEPNHAADIIVIRKTRSGDPYGSVTHAAPQDLELVVINGKPIYGNPELLKELTGVDYKDKSITVCGAHKAFTSTTSFQATAAKLEPELQRLGRGLAPLAECGD